MLKNKHYITIDAHGYITDRWSDGPSPGRDTAGAICLTERGGYQFRFTPGGEENPPVCTPDGIPLYRWENGQVVRRTEEEIALDRASLPAPAPSEAERLRADVDFLSAMMGVTL